MADLERRLAHAMAEVARLREEAGGPSLEKPTAYEPYVPGDARPEPQVTLDGVPVAAGDGRLTEAVRRGEPVVVRVDGHAVPIDSTTALRDLFGSGLFTDLQQTLGLLGSPQRTGAWLPDPDKVERIAPGPRPVPLGARLAAVCLGPVELFVLLVLTVAPMALWILVPGALLLGSILGTVLVGLRCSRLYRRRVPLLTWGEVATVTSVQESIGSSSYSNVPMRRARGWDARWQSYTGSGRSTEIGYTVAGRAGSITLRGAPYDGGVVLADPRSPGRALCVSELWTSVKPGPDGRLPRGIQAGAAIGAVVTLGLLATMVVAAVLSAVALVA